MGNKKQFGNVIDNILSDEQQERAEAAAPRGKGRPKMEDYERRTFIVRKDLFCKLNLIAAKESLLQKDIIEFALENAIERYEKKHGELDISNVAGHKRNVNDVF